jgi:hypothetical protein
MKATITNCLAELVENRFGKERWTAIVADAGLQSCASKFRLPTSDVPEDQVRKLLSSTCRVLSINSQEAADAFGEYWCCTYAPRLYGVIVRRFKNAREMILGLDEVHVMMTATIPNARPPRFDYRWEGENTLNVTYHSPRDLIEIYIGLVKGVGKFFKEKLVVTRLSAQHVKIQFS